MISCYLKNNILVKTFMSLCPTQIQRVHLQRSVQCNFVAMQKDPSFVTLGNF